MSFLLFQMDPTSIPALELRALAYYQIGEYDVAMTHFREALKYDPEHKGCKVRNSSYFGLMKGLASFLIKAEEHRRTSSHEQKLEDMKVP